MAITDLTLDEEAALAQWDRAENERALEQLQNDIRTLMASESGRRIAWWLLESAGVYQSSYRDSAHAMAYAEGKRAFGLQFLQWISTLTPNDYLLMQQEASNGQHDRQRDRQRAIRDAAG